MSNFDPSIVSVILREISCIFEQDGTDTFLVLASIVPEVYKSRAVFWTLGFSLRNSLIMMVSAGRPPYSNGDYNLNTCASSNKDMNKWVS